MKYIIGDAIFDTNKAEKVVEWKQYTPWLFREYVKISLCVTKKRNWVLITSDGNCKRISELEAKSILEEKQAIEEYEKYFGKLKEL